MQLYLKRHSGTVFSCEFCEISRNTLSTKHLRTNASVKGGNDNRVKWGCDKSLTKYGKSECDGLLVYKWYEWDGLWSEGNEWDGLWPERN